MANRSIQLNSLNPGGNSNADLKAPEVLGGQIGLVASTHPIKAGSGMHNQQDDKAIARHEILCDLDDVLESAAMLYRRPFCYGAV